MKLKKTRELLDLKQRDLLRLVVGLIDAATNTEAEDLNLQQIRAFRQVIKEMTEIIECSKVNSLLKTPISAGLKPVPDLRYFEPIQV